MKRLNNFTDYSIGAWGDIVMKRTSYVVQRAGLFGIEYHHDFIIEIIDIIEDTSKKAIEAYY
jgi:hypothetical protein